MSAIGWGLFRLLQVLAFIAAIVTGVATASTLLKDYRPNAATAFSPPSIYIGHTLEH
jgi:hypothetical protein